MRIFENSVDPDQLASVKPADQDPRRFSLCLKTHANSNNLANSLGKTFNMTRVTS